MFDGLDVMRKPIGIILSSLAAGNGLKMAQDLLEVQSKSKRVKPIESEDHCNCPTTTPFPIHMDINSNV